METQQKNQVAAYAILAAAVVIAGVSIAVGLTRIREAQRTVTVRGLAEREVDADLAVWPLKFTLTGNDLTVLQKEVTARIGIVKDYLQKHGLSGDSVVVKEPAITDTSANPYTNQTESKARYIAKTTVLVRSSSVSAVKKALSDSLELIGQGIAIASDYDSQVNYVFTGLNDIKPQMIAEATQNARLAAEQFARDSGSKVGKIRNANQGLFSIEDASPGLPEKKAVRVVNSVEYILTD